MKHFFTLMIILMFSNLTFSQVEVEIENHVNEFFEALNAKDEKKLADFFTPEANLQSVLVQNENERIINEAIEDFFTSIASLTNEVEIREEISDIHIQVDEYMAFASTNYRFFVNGNFSHKGVNYFTFVKVNEKWKIISITDTRIYE